MVGSTYNISIYISASESMGQMKRRTDSEVALNSVLFYHNDHQHFRASSRLVLRARPDWYFSQD